MKWISSLQNFTCPSNDFVENQWLKLLMVCHFLIHIMSLTHPFIHSAHLSLNKYLLSTYYVLSASTEKTLSLTLWKLTEVYFPGPPASKLSGKLTLVGVSYGVRYSNNFHVHWNLRINIRFIFKKSTIMSIPCNKCNDGVMHQK